MTLNIVNRPDTAPAWAQTASAGDVERPSDAFISAGWVQSAEPPYRQYFNWILGWLAQSVAYLRQSGIPLWDPEESYPADAVVIHNHGLWVSKRENTNVAPGTSPDDWAGAAELLAGSGDVVQKIVAGTGVTVSPVEGTGEVTISATGGGGGGGGGGVIPPSPGDHSLDAGFWRIIVGTGTTITGYLDTVTMPKPLGAVLAISVTEAHAVGWGTPGPNGEVTGTVTAFGTSPHPDPDKFKLSCAAWDTVRNKWYYSGLSENGGSVSIQYIAIGENPDYVPPTPAP